METTDPEASRLRVFTPRPSSATTTSNRAVVRPPIGSATENSVAMRLSVYSVFAPRCVTRTNDGVTQLLWSSSSRAPMVARSTLTMGSRLVRSSGCSDRKLTNARPTKYTGPALTGKGTDVAIEELVLAYERLDLQ